MTARRLSTHHRRVADCESRRAPRSCHSRWHLCPPGATSSWRVAGSDHTDSAPDLGLPAASSAARSRQASRSRERFRLGPRRRSRSQTAAERRRRGGAVSPKTADRPEALCQYPTEEPLALALSADQLKLAYYQNYNGGYDWRWNAVTATWEKLCAASTRHADDCRRSRSGGAYAPRSGFIIRRREDGFQLPAGSPAGSTSCGANAAPQRRSHRRRYGGALSPLLAIG